MPRHDLGRHYNASVATIRRWIAETGEEVSFRKGIVARNRRPVPDDWQAVGPTKCLTALLKHYRVSEKVLQRWIAETGIKPAAPVRTGFVQNLSRMGRVHKARENSTRIKTIYEEAADDLRRERFLVNRCNEKGGFDPKGAFWRVGWSICTPDELLARAAKYRRAA